MKIKSLDKMSIKQREFFGVVNAPIIKITLRMALQKEGIKARVKCYSMRNGFINLEVTGLRENTKNAARFFSVKATIVGTKVMNFIYIGPTPRVRTMQVEAVPGKRDKLITLSQAIGAMDNMGFFNVKIACEAMEESQNISHFEQKLQRVLDGLNVEVGSLFKNADWNSK